MKEVNRCSHKVVVQSSNIRMISEPTHKLQRSACRSAAKNHILTDRGTQLNWPRKSRTRLPVYIPLSCLQLFRKNYTVALCCSKISKPISISKHVKQN